MSELTPKTRHEAFLDDIGGGNNNLTPRTREEHYLKQIAQNGGSGGGGLVVNISQVEGGKQLDKTAAEIWAALQNMPVSFVSTYSDDGSTILMPARWITSEITQEGAYIFSVNLDYQQLTFRATEGTDYPFMSMSDPGVA